MIFQNVCKVCFQSVYIDLVLSCFPWSDSAFRFTAIEAAERDALEQKNNVHKLQEAKAAVDRNEGVATLKRQRAQMLMENADLATYKAMMALKIAEAAQIDEPPEVVASLFLG